MTTLQDLLIRLGLTPPADETALQPLRTALTHTSAGLEVNHEELEFLGDAVLRLTCAEFLEEDNPKLSVGERSAFRAQLVSDRWLAKLAAELELDGLIRQGQPPQQTPQPGQRCGLNAAKPWWVLCIWLGAEPTADCMPCASGWTPTGGAAALNWRTIPTGTTGNQHCKS